MYITQIKARVKSGKLLEAMQTMAALAAQMKAGYPDSNPQVFTQSFGPDNIVIWQDQASDLNSMEARNDNLTARPEFMGLMIQYGGLMIEGSIEISLLRQRV